jgi:hypothetical protein
MTDQERIEYYERHDEEYRDGNVIASLFLIFVGLMMGVGLTILFNSCVKNPEPIATKSLLK